MEMNAVAGEAREPERMTAIRRATRDAGGIPGPDTFSPDGDPERTWPVLNPLPPYFNRNPTNKKE
jgi:hypothetical protein